MNQKPKVLMNTGGSIRCTVCNQLIGSEQFIMYPETTNPEVIKYAHRLGVHIVVAQLIR